MIVGVDARELQGRPTGTGRYLRNLLRHWTATTDDRFVLYFNGPAPADPVLEHARVRRRPLGGRPTRGLLWQELRLPAAAREDGLDVLFCPAYTCPLSLRVPRVTAVHDFSYFSVPHDFPPVDGLRRRVLVTATLRASRVILACSDFTRREILGRFPALEDRVLHVPLAADDDLPPPPGRDEARARLGLSGPLALSVGTILNRRCLPVLLRALQILGRAWPRLTLDVVGDNRTHPRLDLPGLVGRLDLADRVRLSGFVSEAGLADRYAAADVAVFLSEYEGFGLPVLEALSRGLPVVAGDRPALSEIFAGGVLFVEPRDVVGSAEALDRLLRDSSLREALASRGRALASRFSWAEAAARTREALSRAAAR